MIPKNTKYSQLNKAEVENLERYFHAMPDSVSKADNLIALATRKAELNSSLDESSVKSTAFSPQDESKMRVIKKHQQRLAMLSNCTDEASKQECSMLRVEISLIEKNIGHDYVPDQMPTKPAIKEPQKVGDTVASALPKEIEIVEEKCLNISVPPFQIRSKMSREELAKRYGVHPDSIAIVHTIWREVRRKKKSIAQKRDTCLLNIKYAHDDDKEHLRTWLKQQIFIEGPELIADNPQRKSVAHVKTDPHMTRAAVLSGDSDIIRLYWIIRQLDIDVNNGSGLVAMDSLKKRLRVLSLNIGSSFRRWLLKGEELGYWKRWYAGKKATHVQYSSIRKMPNLLFSRLSEEQIEDFRGDNGFGCRMIWIDVSGGQQHFRGNALGAWYEQRSEDGVTISNQTLGDMWNVTNRTIYNRNTRAGVPKTANYADGTKDNPAAKHAVTDDDSNTHWRMVNTYQAPHDTRRHAHIGQKRKVRKAVSMALKERFSSPAVEYAVGEQEQRYFDGKKPHKAAERAKKEGRVADIIYLHEENRRYSKRSFHRRFLAEYGKTSA